MKDSGTRKAHRDYTQKIKSNPQSVSFTGNDCVINIKTILLNIQPACASLREEDVLDVRLEPDDKVAVVNINNEICGYIGSAMLSRIIQCIKNGTSYKATISSIVDKKYTVHFENN